MPTLKLQLDSLTNNTNTCNMPVTTQQAT